jgi:hypothetical protein
MKTKRRTTTLLALLLAALSAGASFALALPDIPGFTAGETRTTELTAPSGNYGRWTTRTYRAEGGRSAKATVLAGPGTGPLVTGPVGTRGDDRPMGFGSTYEVLELRGRPAVFEEIPTLGRSLAVAVEDTVTLTLESPSLSREELLDLAGSILGSAP